MMDRNLLRRLVRSSAFVPLSVAVLVGNGSIQDLSAQQKGRSGTLNSNPAPANGANKGNPQQAKAPAANANANAAAPVAGTPTAANRSTPSVVALVNNEPIPREVLARECVLRYGNTVLENLLNKSLIMQACRAQNIEITEKMIDEEIGRIALKFNLSPKLYLQLIEDERGIKPKQYADDIVWPMLALRALAKDKIRIDQKEIDAAYESEYGPTVKVRMIAVSDPKKAAELHKQVMADPSSFKRLAKEHSEDPSSAMVEGLLPPIHKFSGDDEIEKLAFGLRPDEISKLVKIGDMSLFLQCVRHDPATPPSRDQMDSVLLRIRMGLEDEKLRGMAEEVFAKLREQSNVVKVMGDANLEKQNPGTAAFINRQPLLMSLLEDECIKRHGTLVLEGEIHRKILEGAMKAANQQITQKDIDLEIGRAAEYYGFIKPDMTPDVDKWLKTVLDDPNKSLELYIRDEVWPTVALKKLVESRVQLTKEDLQKGFESNYGPRAEILAVVLSNHRTAQEVWQMARDNPTEQFFGELAAQYSVEATSRSNFGKVQPIRRHGSQPTLEKVAFELKPGELSGIVEVNSQYVILRSQGFTTPVVKDFESVREILSKDLIEKKTRIAMQDEMDRLLKQASIDNFIDVKKSQAGSDVIKAAATGPANGPANAKPPIRK